MQGNEAGGIDVHRLCSDQGAPGNPSQLQAQRKEIRGPVAPGGPIPESPHYSSSQSPDCVKLPGAPPQRVRLPEEWSLQEGNLHFSTMQIISFHKTGSFGLTCGL